MWRRRTKSVCIGVSASQVAWVAPGTDALVVVDRAASTDLADLVGQAFEGLSFDSPGSVHVVVGAEIARHWMQTPPAGLRSFAELRELVHSKAEQLFESDWPWTVAADWHATRPFLCAAIPQPIDDAATRLAKRWHVSRRLQTSLMTACLRHASAAPDGWLALHEPGALHLLNSEAGQLTVLRTLAVASELEGDALARETTDAIARAAALAGGLDATARRVVSLAGRTGISQAEAACEQAGWLALGGGA